ncbi:hypothetical protein XELAEV_18007876mg [Xenopus laevis]|uniref:Uncharacterized protein n=1 Tax=Xenopus laevis TaxID=8355 RepID=A0A974E1J2_XENLA|nr:hypothetical protein XELAEV_18007876mg [Xenopus laevis]
MIPRFSFMANSLSYIEVNNFHGIQPVRPLTWNIDRHSKLLEGFHHTIKQFLTHCATALDLRQTLCYCY